VLKHQVHGDIEGSTNKSFIHFSNFSQLTYADYPVVTVNKRAKTIPVTGCVGLWGCETLILLHFLDNPLTDDHEVVSLTCQPAAHFPHEDSWYSFLLEADLTPGPWCGWTD
jgi:hypothetical protein